MENLIVMWTEPDEEGNTIVRTDIAENIVKRMKERNNYPDDESALQDL